MEFKLLLDVQSELAETPIWDERIGKWYWTELFSGAVHRYNPATGKDEVWETGKMIGSAIPCDDVNKLLCVLEDGAHLLDLTTGKLAFLARPENIAGNRYNDSRVDAAGRLFMSSVSKAFATPAFSLDQTGKFYMLDTDRKTVKVIVDEIIQYNSIVWNSDNTKMYVIDTYNQTLLMFPYDIAVGPTGGPETVLDFKEIGLPDGMNIDVEDNLYICHWTGKITVWDRNLRLIEEIPFPVNNVCCGGFGGPDMRDFYVATAKFLCTAEDLKANPGTGGIFAARATVTGCPDHFYKTQ